MKRQPPQSSHENAAASSSSTQEAQGIQRESSVAPGRTADAQIVSLRRQIMRQHKRASSGSNEDVLQCPICKERLKSPKITPCQHTFCLQCLKNQVATSNKRDGSFTCPVCDASFDGRAPENFPNNLYIESLLDVMATSTRKQARPPKSTVSFAPLPPKIIRNRESSATLNCRRCSEICEKRCRHCKRGYCYACWKKHVNEDLREELGNINGDLETSATRFEERIIYFRNKANEMKDFISRDIEVKVADLNKRKENRIKKVEHIVTRGEMSVEDIKQRMEKAQAAVKAERNEVSHDLRSNEKKVKVFLDLQQKAAEVMAAIAIWESKLRGIEMGLAEINKRGGSIIKENVGPLYKRKAFAPKIIVNRDMVQRPSALAVDSWRDHIIATCPGSGQVVILDRKFKLMRRIRHREMMAPQGVAFLQENDEIYVTDKWKHCIFVFNHNGKLARRMCSRGLGESQLRSPEGITFHPERNVLYVADTGNDRIQILEKDGSYLDSIGPIGKRAKNAAKFYKTDPIPSHLNQPTDVAVTTTRVVVADSGNHKIKIFDHEGQVLQTIGGVGTSKGLFKSPEVLRIDKKGNIIVGDAGNGRVQIFSPEGEFLRMLGSKGTKERQFGWVSGVLVTNSYDIFVADSKNNVIYLF
ncbi:RING finger protein nhl-1-like [Odontomachus brunneus]|uniref:RING finger protein nhl-1-like n=1 Tax=Odontomachus brunneus TaxID=486640 RepID=UPI0013F26BC8|nr:RING finger protein nhl-1-like [Odontomachus brunneus]XP_032678371.1 RING finger protein nhl-1-like [Odontomachus brunneus]